IYSDFNTEGFYDATQLLGSAVYSPAAASLKQSTSTEEYYREMYVPMPKQLALNIFDKFKESPETFKTPTEFAKFFPGLYITNSYGSGRIMNYYDAELEVFYKSHIVNDTIDTIVSNLRQSYIGVTPEIVTNNNIKLEPDQKIKDRIAAGEAIVMGPAGYELNVNFPIQDIIDKFYATTSDGLAVINTLELTIPVDVIDNEYDIAPPEYLLIVKKDKKDEFFAGDSLTNSKNSFYAKYDAGKKQYRFTGMRDYVLNIINNQKGIATAEDINLCITPIDVTTYTQQSSYYSYYYGGGGTQTVVTKIAPSISKPALARLRLDKAKVKITFSKQTVF
ncbi:MAG: DUF4270 family protein, partial [Muribaculaceae bacterium]|nr:DUF4270 family protein [Muribaculaceae bacterium]